MDAYEAKLDAARLIIEKHNEKADEKIDFASFVTALKKLGGTTDEALDSVSWEDLQETKLPKLIAKQVANAFRTKKDKPAKFLSEKKVRLLSLRELLERYSPKEPDEIRNRLVELADGQRCVVFDDDGKVNVESSLACLEDIRQGLESRTIFVGKDGVPQAVYHIGEFAETASHENPLLPGQSLRGADEQCSKTFRSWAQIAHKIRVILRLALQNKELVIDQVGRIHDTLDLLIGKTPENALQVVMARFPQATISYRELEPLGKLPSLKIVKGSNPRKSDPFFGSTNNRTF